MTDRELMQQALDALESVFEGDDKGAEYWTVTGGTYEAVECMQVMRALRARLAQPEPEPEKSQDKPCVEDDGCPTEKAVLQRFWRKHQAQPEREWVGLTDDEIWKDDGIMAANSGYGATFETLRELARAIEAKLKEKNT